MFPKPALQGGDAAAFSPRLPVGSGSAFADVRGEAEIRVPGRLSVWDWLGMVAGFVLTLTITVVNSRHRIFWEDEMLGWLLLRDPSWHHMVRAWNLGADGGGFSFYVLGRGWFAVFGDSRLAFRLFSSTCFGLAFVALWAALRRVYPTWIVAFAAFNTMFFSPPLTMHFLEGRFYGLLVMSTALAMWLALRLDEEFETTPRHLYVAAFLIHGLLTTSHLLGVVFSFFVLLATVILDRLRGRLRVGLYLTVAVSWLLLIPEKTSIVAAGRVGKPHFWTRAPRLSEIVGGYSGFSHEILLVLGVLFVAAVVLLRRSSAGLGEGYRRRCAAYVVGGCLLLAPLAFLAEGMVGTWLFNERYLQPVTLGLAFVTAELLMVVSTHWVFGSAEGRSMVAARGVGAVVFAAFLLFWVFHHVAMNTPEVPEFTDVLTARLPQDIPVVVDDAFTFTDLIGRQSDSGVEYRFLLDWPWAVSEGSPRLEVTQYHLMENWKLAGYYAENVVEKEAFLREHGRFLIVDEVGLQADPNVKPEIGNPLPARLGTDPQYQMRKVFTLDRAWHDGVRDTVWLACRGGCGADANPIQGPDYCVIYAPDTACCSGQPCMAALPPDVKKKIS